MEAVKAERRKSAAAAPADGAQRRRPLAPSEKNNAAAPAGRRTEGTSRFKPVAPPAPTPTPPPAAPAPRRCSSPSPRRASAADDGSATCNSRARSADRARPAALSPAPCSRLKPLSTAARSDGHSTPPRARNAKASDGLWASASPLLRSEPVQSPASKVDRLVHGLPTEQVKLRPGAVAAERKRSPQRRSSNTTGDQCENARPSESQSPANSVAEKQHRWPGMMTGRGSAGLASTTAAPAGKASRSVFSSDASAGRSPRRTLPSEGETGKNLRRPLNETAKIAHRRRKDRADSASSDTSSQTSESSKYTCRLNKAVSSPVPVLHRSSSPRPGLSAAFSASRSCHCQSLSRMRPSPSASCRSECASSAAESAAVGQPAFNYIVDSRKGKKSAGQIENTHQLRLLSNRYLQWRFVNAYSEETLSHKDSVESILYNVWESILTLRDALTITRTNVQHLQQELKLYGILTEQIGYLEQWPVLEEECNATLAEATEALKASTLRLPVTSGAHADEIAIRNAISSAVDVMQALSSCIQYVHSKVEDRTSLVSELSVMAGQEKVALDQCRELLATAAKLQVQETSLRTHLMQLRQRSAG